MVKENKRLLPVLCVSILLTCVALITFYYADLRYSMGEGIKGYWDSYFICTDSIGCFFDTFGDGVKKLGAYWNGTSKKQVLASSVFIPFFMFALFRFGWSEWKKDRFRIFSIDAIALILFIELVLFGIFKKYPFTGERVTLFFAPFVFYLILKGIECTKRLKYVRFGLLGYYLLLSLFFLANTFSMHLKEYFR